MIEKLKDRNNQIILGFVIIFLILFVRLSNLTIVEGEKRRENSENIRKKDIPIVAPRGEIKDRNGVLIAGNVPSFTVQLVRSELPKKELEEVAIKLIDLLDRNGEKHIEFPILIEDGNYYYSHDRDIENWLESLGKGYENLKDAEAVFNKIVEENLPFEDLEKGKAQEYLIAMNITPPISVSKMKFLAQIEKESFLNSYRLDINIDAKEAFKKIRDKYNISTGYSDNDARKILIIKHALKQQGYLQYFPLRIASDISEESAILIEEDGMELPGIGVAIEPKRHYQSGNLAAHVIGYLGKISREWEIKKYVDEYKYSKNDIIGKTGIEGKYELVLRGQNGVKSVEVDTYGRTVNELEEFIKPMPGKDIYLTIDAKLQKIAEDNLEYALEEVRKGGTFESKWGDYTFSDKTLKNATSGAVVAVDVKTGEILALANYPSYSPELFATGISNKDYKSLLPKNKRDPIAPRPLYNIATFTAVQPGSTFKMLVGLGAIENGLDPTRQFVDGKYIKIGDKTFGSWMWNDYRMSHGSNIDLYKAIEESVNYYFFNLSMDYDYYKKKPLNLGIGINTFLDYATKFGLGDKTGIEIREVSYGVPDPEGKARNIKYLLKRKLEATAKNYFEDEILNDEEKLSSVVSEIVNWGDENPSRGKIIRDLKNIGVKEEKIYELADLVKYSYFNQMKFKEGDAFNLSIGQGDHAYTPIQMARYISAIANGGYLNDLRLTKKVGDEIVKGKPAEKIVLKNDNNLNHIKKGMLKVTQGSEGTARKLFKDFPVKVAAKTGTAQRFGKIPPESEVDYLKQYLSQIAPDISFESINSKSLEILNQRKEEISKLQDELEKIQEELAALEQANSGSENGNDDKEQKEINNVRARRDRAKKKIITRLTKGYFDEGTRMREAIKQLTDNRVTDEDIDRFKEDYDNFAWFVSFAPYEEPEIAIVTLLFQGGHGGYGAPIAREMFAEYFKLELPVEDEVESTNN
ncbi:penicillin-binding transpeptidase domain-containing protein [Wukongibacter baidiensis]|uniref:penicillin-binding transpeptidase domain-containing protein n=1 Tax=Wukongibacter baidiensis TaxID=1723361 RepID=UPI003D7F8B80